MVFSSALIVVMNGVDSWFERGFCKASPEPDMQGVVKDSLVCVLNLTLRWDRWGEAFLQCGALRQEDSCVMPAQFGGQMLSIEVVRGVEFEMETEVSWVSWVSWASFRPGLRVELAWATAVGSCR